MKKRAKFLLVLLAAASAMVAVSCKPIPYYLERVYKAHGRVTEAATGAPLESVEVFLGTYQYSVLTNGLGDYGIELAEGTWQLEFIKEGYATQSRQVTVTAAEPRVKVDVALAPTAGPERGWSFVGNWGNSSYDEGHGARPPAVFAFTSTLFRSYDYTTDTSAMSVGSFSLAAEWTDGSFHYFKGDAVITSGSGAGSHAYVLMRVGNNDDTLEISSSPAASPATITDSAAIYQRLPDFVGTWQGPKPPGTATVTFTESSLSGFFDYGSGNTVTLSATITSYDTSAKHILTVITASSYAGIATPGDEPPAPGTLVYWLYSVSGDVLTLSPGPSYPADLTNGAPLTRQ